eukprot:scaffold1126_cov242-Pinguiococcus_pyrenoidosus.AAC.3
MKKKRKLPMPMGAATAGKLAARDGFDQPPGCRRWRPGSKSRPRYCSSHSGSDWSWRLASGVGPCPRSCSNYSTSRSPSPPKGRQVLHALDAGELHAGQLHVRQDVNARGSVHAAGARLLPVAARNKVWRLHPLSRRGGCLRRHALPVGLLGGHLGPRLRRVLRHGCAVEDAPRRQHVRVERWILRELLPLRVRHAVHLRNLRLGALASLLGDAVVALRRGDHGHLRPALLRRHAPVVGRLRVGERERVRVAVLRGPREGVHHRTAVHHLRLPKRDLRWHHPRRDHGRLSAIHDHVSRAELLLAEQGPRVHLCGRVRLHGSHAGCRGRAAPGRAGARLPSGPLDPRALRHALEEAALQLRELSAASLDLLGAQLVHVRLSAAEDLLADAILAHELLGDPHGVAVQQLAEEGAQRGAVREGQKARLELLDQTVGIGLLFHRPLASAEAVGLGLLLVLFDIGVCRLRLGLRSCCGARGGRPARRDGRRRLGRHSVFGGGRARGGLDVFGRRDSPHGLKYSFPRKPTSACARRPKRPNGLLRVRCARCAPFERLRTEETGVWRARRTAILAYHA